MKIKFHVPTQQYGFLEIEGEHTELKDAEVLYNKYAETPISFKKNEVRETKKLKSFTEDVEVDFDEVNHKYFFNGSPLQGATTFLKKFVPEFDAKSIAKNCEKSWGIPASDIEELWENNRVVSTDFGTVVHKTLEHYFKSKEKGFDDEKSMPKHPILRDIIVKFNDLTAGDNGEVLSEVLVTNVSKERCGQLDRLLIVDKKKKICRIQDYKVNVGSEEVSSKNKLLAPYNTLPANKLSKYQLQLNFYAQILEEAGWTVEGLDVFVYEDTWKRFELGRITI